MEPSKQIAKDDEGCRLFARYEESSAQEIAATYRLLYPGRRLPHETYMEMVGSLQAIRTTCNNNMLALRKHRSKMLGLTVPEPFPQ